MSITESVHHYNVGTLITVSTEKLKLAQTVLENKIGYMSQVAKQQSVCTEVYSDMRKYELVRSEIARLIEDRGKGAAPLFHASKGVRFNQPVHREIAIDYTII